MNRLEADRQKLTPLQKKKIISVVIFSFPFCFVFPFCILNVSNINFILYSIFSCTEERKEIVEHTYSKSISRVLTHLSKLFEINLKLYFNLRLSADAVYPKLKICFMGKCVDLPPDNLCQLNADIFSGNFYNCCFSGIWCCIHQLRL